MPTAAGACSRRWSRRACWSRCPGSFLNNRVQPSRSASTCAEHTSLPMVLDEVITDVQSLLRAWRRADGSVQSKDRRVGGLTKAKLMRDLSETLGIEGHDRGLMGRGSHVAAVSHLAASSTPDTLFTVSFMNDWTKEQIAGYQPRSARQVGRAPTDRD